jgi:predicted outer membrane repeat protein
LSNRAIFLARRVPEGGAILNAGTLRVARSTVDGNDSDAHGAGVEHLSGALTITRSTFSRNVAGGYGGGLDATRGTVAVGNATFSGNSAAYGGGIATNGNTTLTHATVVDNDATSGTGGGLNYHFGYPTMNLIGTIIAGNRQGGSTTSPTADCGGTAPQASNYNLFGQATGCGGTSLDVLVVPASVFTTVLGPLANNGGPTLTHALLAGSSAIDRRASCTDTILAGVDQRAVSRPRDGNGDGVARCDIGAFER